MTPIDRLRKAKVSIMRHKKFCAFSGVLACGETTVTNVPTACTDGWNIQMGEAFMDELTDPQLRFVLLHEAMHKAYKHLHVWRTLWEQNKGLANVAMDHFVNLSLSDMCTDDFIKMPPVGVQPEPKYRGWSVDMIFRDLQANGEDGGNEGGDEGGDEGGGMDDHDWDGAGTATQEQRETQAQEIDRAVRQGEALAKKRGSGSGDSDGVFGDLLRPEPDWRELLREFVQEQCAGRDESTWRKPNRRYLTDDVYMPSCISENMGELVIGIDTSGSCFGTAYMTKFVSEMAGIISSVRPDKVRVVYWDSIVQSEQVFENGEFSIGNIKPRGGGGTHGHVLFDYLREKSIVPQAIVQFTDGYVGNWGNTSVPTLWAVTERGITAPFGRTVHIKV